MKANPNTTLRFRIIETIAHEVTVPLPKGCKKITQALVDKLRTQAEEKLSDATIEDRTGLECEHVGIFEGGEWTGEWYEDGV